MFHIETPKALDQTKYLHYLQKAKYPLTLSLKGIIYVSQLVLYLV
jgi:hypothetical protein